MKKTKIEWCDSTWNPVTGCFHNCKYCYASKIATRFGGASETHHNETVGTECQWITEAEGKIHEIDEPIYDYDMGRNAPYPFEFDPTFHRYRLDIPEQWTKPKTIFVCSMADLFGDWVPDSWIEGVFSACDRAPQHRYLFLTKNPKRLCDLANAGKLPKRDNWWFGSTVTNKSALRYPGRLTDNTFISIEPILENLDAGLGSFGSANWIIVGAETGNRKDKVVPEKEWIDNICEAADITHAAVFMKDSLIPIIGEENMRREYPWKQEGNQ